MAKGQRLKPEQIATLFLSLKSSVVGYLVLGSKLLILNQAALGRMAFVKALMAPSETTFWMGRSSTALKKPRLS